MQAKRFTVYDLAVIGLMAAVCFVVSYFIKIEIPTPAGPTMIKLGNAFCLLAGMLFGGLRGGLAAGIGSMFYDLTSPAFVPYAPFTLVFFFLMAFVCGCFSKIGWRKGHSVRWDLTGAVCGSVLYLILHFTRSIGELVLAGSDFYAALTAMSLKFVTSGINAVIAVLLSVLLAAILRPAIQRTGILQKLGRKS